MTTTSTRPAKASDSGERTPVEKLGIVVAVDGSRSSLVTAEAAGRLADEWKVPVHLVSVLPPFADYGAHPEGDEPASQVEDLRIQLRDAALRKMLDKLHRTNEWSHEVVVGRLPAALVTAADRCGARVIFWPCKQ
ncbi:MAG TPA: universal stress protein [Gemmatimonadaceae bacterium]|nr:universal stress protein [Gemmatimonadaceae bacterium]